MITKPKPGFRINPLHPLSRGLVGWWLLNEGGGPTAFDYSGKGNHGTLANGPTWVGSPLGQALEFDGVDDVVSIAQHSSINNLDLITISAWVYARSYGEGSLARIVDKINASTDGAFLVHIDNDGIGPAEIINFAAFRWQTTNGEWRSQALDFSLNTWNHIVVVYDYGSITNDPFIYLNGRKLVVTEESTPSGTKASETETFNIGNNTATNRTFDGSIDDVRVYNRILSEIEIQQLFTSPYANIITTATRRTQAFAGFVAAAAAAAGGGKFITLRRRRRMGR